MNPFFEKERETRELLQIIGQLTVDLMREKEAVKHAKYMTNILLDTLNTERTEREVEKKAFLETANVLGCGAIKRDTTQSWVRDGTGTGTDLNSPPPPPLIRDTAQSWFCDGTNIIPIRETSTSTSDCNNSNAETDPITEIVPLMFNMKI